MLSLYSFQFRFLWRHILLFAFNGNSLSGVAGYSGITSLVAPGGTIFSLFEWNRWYSCSFCIFMTLYLKKLYFRSCFLVYFMTSRILLLSLLKRLPYSRSCYDINLTCDIFLYNICFLRLSPYIVNIDVIMDGHMIFCASYAVEFIASFHDDDIFF